VSRPIVRHECRPLNGTEAITTGYGVTWPLGTIASGKPLAVNVIS
jgi:hypothetical protein